MKKWTYHRTHSFVENKERFIFDTQLYKTGIYAIINNDPALQFNLTPKDIVKVEKKLRKEEKEGKIKELSFGLPITVIEDEQGFYKEIKLEYK